MSSNSNNLTWAADNNQNRFISTDQTRLRWIETINNVTHYNFKFVRYYKDNGLLIYDKDRNVHVLINNNRLKSGYALDQLNLLYTGEWINLDDSKSLSEHFRSLSSARTSPSSTGPAEVATEELRLNSSLIRSTPSSNNNRSPPPVLSQQEPNESFDELDSDGDEGVPANESKLSVIPEESALENVNEAHKDNVSVLSDKELAEQLSNALKDAIERESEAIATAAQLLEQTIDSALANEEANKTKSRGSNSRADSQKSNAGSATSSTASSAQSTKSKPRHYILNKGLYATIIFNNTGAGSSSQPSIVLENRTSPSKSASNVSRISINSSSKRSGSRPVSQTSRVSKQSNSSRPGSKTASLAADKEVSATPLPESISEQAAKLGLDGSSVLVAQTLDVEQSFVPSTVTNLSEQPQPTDSAPVLEASIFVRTYRTKLTSRKPNSGSLKSASVVSKKSSASRAPTRTSLTSQASKLSSRVSRQSLDVPRLNSVSSPSSQSVVSQASQSKSRTSTSQNNNSRTNSRSSKVSQASSKSSRASLEVEQSVQLKLSSRNSSAVHLAAVPQEEQSPSSQQQSRSASKASSVVSSGSEEKVRPSSKASSVKSSASANSVQRPASVRSNASQRSSASQRSNKSTASSRRSNKHNNSFQANRTETVPVAESVNENLVHHWPFKGDLNDVVSGAHLFEGKNVSFTTDRHNNESSALSLNDGFVQAPQGVYFNGEFTISAWVKLNTVGNFTRLLDFGDSDFADNVFASLTWDSFGNPYLNVDRAGNEGVPVLANASLNPGVWNHLVFTLNQNGESQIYLNNQLIGQGKTSVPRNVKRTKNFIGWSNASNKNYQQTYANYDLSDLKIYDRALTHDEVKAEFSN